MVFSELQEIAINKSLTANLKDQIEKIIKKHDDKFSRAKDISRNILGARPIGNSSVRFGFWIPGLGEGKLADISRFKLELFTPLEDINFELIKNESYSSAKFKKETIQLEATDEYLFGVVDNVKIGTKENTGSFYWVKYIDQNGKENLIRDVLALSLPFGIYAPAEVYDLDQIQENRKDLEFFRSFYKAIYPDGSYRAKDIGVHMEVHVGAATKEGTYKALTAKYKSIAAKISGNIKAGKPDVYEGLNTDELNYIGFDTIELMPEVPPVEREGEESPTGEFFRITSESDSEIEVNLKKPDIVNWGYDTPILGTVAINPTHLATGRLDEFIEFLETLHNMPDRPIQVALDSVLGHADFQAAKLLQSYDRESPDPRHIKYTNSRFFRGPNMYGLDINYAEPHVRAIFLELYKRKLDLGVDAIRVDGGQDFIKEMCPETGFRIQDDEFINDMICLEQNINDIVRRCDINVEDGRPWPNDMNWLYNSTYIEHILDREMPFGDEVKQWSPLIFAHNVHGKFKWFMNKWDRYKDSFKEGEHWITGHSNHDNSRYFYRLTQTKPGSLYEKGEDFDDYYNDQMGKTNTETAHNILDNPALSTTLMGFLPGNPMFFLNKLFHTPWLFFRDTDDQYGVKVASDEGSRFLTWYVDDELYNKDSSFVRLKGYGFESLSQLVTPEKAGFMDILFKKNELIKTDPAIFLYLYDAPESYGGYQDNQELKIKIERLASPVSEEDKNYRKMLDERISLDPIESNRKCICVQKQINKAIGQLETERGAVSLELIPEIDLQLDKLRVIKEIIDNGKDAELALLVEDANLQNEYALDKWAEDEELLAAAPAKLKNNGKLSAQILKDFARDFMLDAYELCNVSKYEDNLDEERVKYNFALRKFRQDNYWLTKNPSNNVKKDYFGRKISTNGAKNAGGGVFTDKVDIINANTVYYGWRTNPDTGKKIFLIANMEGKPIYRYALNQCMLLSGDWRVLLKSPGLEDVPEVVNKDYVIENFRNGDAMILEQI